MTRLFLLLLTLALPARAADFTGLDWQQRQGAMLPTEAPLIDADGHATTLAQIAGGKPLILAPGYFQCPNLCGVVRDDLFAALAESGLQPGRDYNAALITIDPTETLADAKSARESVLSRYPDAQFATLTGPKSSLDAVADAAGFKSRFDQATKQFLHPAGVVIASPSGRISTYLMGVGYGGQKLARRGHRRRSQPHRPRRADPPVLLQLRPDHRQIQRLRHGSPPPRRRGHRRSPSAPASTC